MWQGILTLAGYILKSLNHSPITGFISSMKSEGWISPDWECDGELGCIATSSVNIVRVFTAFICILEHFFCSPSPPNPRFMFIHHIRQTPVSKETHSWTRIPSKQLRVKCFAQEAGSASLAIPGFDLILVACSSLLTIWPDPGFFPSVKLLVDSLPTRQVPKLRPVHEQACSA